jgi:hypothetical protein
MRTQSFSKLGGNGAGRFSDPRIIEFRPRRRSSKMAAPVIDPLRRFEIDDYRRRMQQNIAAAAVLLVLVVAGLWLFHQLRESSRVLACVEAGLRDCLPIDHTLWPTHRIK